MSQTEQEAAPSVQHVEDILKDTRSKMEQELEELRPAHEAFERLSVILSNFDTITQEKVATRKVNGQRAPRGTRAQEFATLVREAGEQGITVTQAADKMDGINPNYLYRIAKDLTDAGEIRKEEKLYFPVVTEEAPASESESEKGEGEGATE